MSKIKTKKIKWLIIGAAFGYFVFHPLIHLISVAHFYGESSEPLYIVSEILSAYSVSMLPWSLAFMVLNALIGLFWGKIKQADKDKSNVIMELQEALVKVKALSGLLPICAACKKIRDDQGYWNQIEAYLKEHSEAEFSHSICPECVGKLYPEFCPEILPSVE
jgi:hypothetical protein